MKVALGVSLGWVNTALNVTNTVVSGTAAIISATKSGGGHSQPQVVHHNTTVQERPLTPEEIKIKQEQHDQWLKQQEFNRAMQMQQSADMRRFLDPNIDKNQPKNDNLMVYGVLGLVLVAIVFKSIQK